MNSPQRKQRRITSDKIDQTKPVPVIVARFGGLSEFSRKTGFAVGTVHGWMVSGFVPNRSTAEGKSYQAHILDVAKEAGVPLEAGDFIQPAQPAEV